MVSFPKTVHKLRQPFRPIDVVGVLVLSVVAWCTYYETLSYQLKLNESLESVGARCSRDYRNSIVAVAINDKKLDGADVFAVLPRLHEVESLSFSRSSLPGNALENLPHMKRLRSLSLLDTDVGDIDMTPVSACRHLESVSLAGTDITSDGLSHLQNLVDLKRLLLARTGVNDGCVDLLAALPALQEVDLRSTNLTSRGIERLRALKPRCQITWDGRSNSGQVL